MTKLAGVLRARNGQRNARGGGGSRLVSNGLPLRGRMVVSGRFACGRAGVGGGVERSGSQSELFGAVVAVASVVP